MKRRTVLGSLAAVATAGCIGSPGGGGGDGSTARLARLSVKNEDAREHTVHVIVKRGGDIVHWSSHALASTSGSEPSRENVSCTWGDDDGQFEILARLDDATEWRSTVVDDQADCYQASVEVDGDGALGVWFMADCNIPDSETCDVPSTTATDE
jgi:hypothetical protein